MASGGVRSALKDTTGIPRRDPSCSICLFLVGGHSYGTCISVFSSATGQGHPAALDPRPLPDPVDLSRYGHWGRDWLSVPGCGRPLQHRGLGWDNQCAHCAWAHPDDVPASGEGALRRARRRLSQLEGPGPLSGAELGDRSDPHVCPRGSLPAGVSRVYDRPDLNWPGTLHCHGHCLERTRQGGHRLCGGARGV